MNEDEQIKLDNSWMMEEYKALRAEILANEDYQKNLLIFGTSVLAAAFGFIFRDSALESHRCILLFLTQILAVGFWHAFERLALSTEEIGTYIACHFEKYFALNWEIFQRATTETPTEQAKTADPQLGERLRPKKKDVTKNPKKSFWRRFFNACSQLPFVIFSFVCSVLIIKETLSKQDAMNFTITAFSVILSILMLTAIVYYEKVLKSVRRLVDETDARLKVTLQYRKHHTLYVSRKEQPESSAEQEREPDA